MTGDDAGELETVLLKVIGNFIITWIINKKIDTLLTTLTNGKRLLSIGIQIHKTSC